MDRSLGRGLDALINKNRGSGAESENTDRKVDLNRQLLEIGKLIEDKEEKAEKLRQHLTVDLMLGKTIDKSKLLEIENEIRSMKDKKSMIKAELEMLTSGKYDEKGDSNANPEREVDDLQKRKSDIDMRMVRQLMGDGDDKEEESEVPDDEEYLEKLKEENHPRSKLQAVRNESMRISKSDIKPKRIRRRIKKEPVKISKKRVRRIRKKTFEKGSPEYHKTVNGVISRSVGLIEAGRLEEGIEILEHANSLYPEDDELLYHLGNAYFLLGDLDSAYNRLKNAVKINRKNFRAYNNIGVILQRTGHLEEGIRALNHSLEINEDYERAWYNLGSIFMDLDPPLLRESAVFLRRALDLDPNYLRAKEKLRKCKEMQGRM